MAGDGHEEEPEEEPEEEEEEEEEEEVECPKPVIEEACKPQCVKALLEYQACVERVATDDSGEAHCTGQYFDYWHCIDLCAAPELFKQLK